MRAGGRTYIHADVTKVIVAFSNFANKFKYKNYIVYGKYIVVIIITTTTTTITITITIVITLCFQEI
jgi:hypothetical protein